MNKTAAKPSRRKKRARRGVSPIEKTVEAYIEGVLNGTIAAGELTRLAVKRHLLDLENGKKRGLYFDKAKAERVIEFSSYLKHSKGEWARQLFVLSASQMFEFWVLFGWMRADGTRRFRVAYDEEARKNGKSTKAAVITLYMAFSDGEMGAEVYSAATKKEQAIIVHGEAVRMVRATPELADKIQIYKNNLSRVETNQKFEPLGADEDTLDGLNVHCAAIDEVHAHRTRGVYDVIATACGARRQPLIYCITTAGTDQTEASICWELHCYAEQVLRGIVQDDSFFAVIYSMDDGDDWQEEKNWYKANPNLGISKKLDYVRDQAKKAAKMPSFLNTFLRLELNKWTQQVTRWIDMDLWDQNAGPAIDEAGLVGRLCYGGIDLSSVSDLTAWVLLFPDPVVVDRVTVLVRLWCPESKLYDEHNRYREQYQAWARDGWLLTTPGNAIDYDQIERQIVEDAATFKIQEIAVDRLFQGYQLSMRLQEQHGLTVAACGMGYMSMAGPCAEFERRLLEKKLHHGDHPVLRWMANNVAVREDPAGNKKPDKSSSQGKIDGIVAMLLALDRFMRQQNTASVYETRGMLTVGG